jgi:hypothetical protein
MKLFGFLHKKVQNMSMEPGRPDRRTAKERLDDLESHLESHLEHHKFLERLFFAAISFLIPVLVILINLIFRK